MINLRLSDEPPKRVGLKSSIRHPPGVGVGVACKQVVITFAVGCAVPAVIEHDYVAWVALIAKEPFAERRAELDFGRTVSKFR